ncbi:MAG: hypothetical protein ACLTTO_08520 [Lachnospiraceae bacterium]
MRRDISATVCERPIVRDRGIAMIDAETMEPKLTIVGNEGTKPVGICVSPVSLI